MSTTTKNAAPKSDAPKTTTAADETLAARAKRQKAAPKTTAAKKTTAAAPKKTTAKRTTKNAPKTTAPKTTAKPDAPKTDDPDRAAAALATALLKFGGAYANASGVSAKQLRTFQTAALAGTDAMSVLTGGQKVTQKAAIGLATGQTKPTAEQKAAWHEATKRYAKAAFGTDGPTTKNKLTGRKIACVLAAIADANGQLKIGDPGRIAI